jgi:hypothetical protein
VDYQELDPSAEVAHLRRLLDTQPSCLLRLGADGVVLAANDAALTLLGMASHAQALGRDFAAWLPPDHHDRWRAFARQVAEGCPASIECDITGPSGDRQATLFHAVPLPGHPDGLASIAVTARAVAAHRQLEAAMVERESVIRELDAELLQARARLRETEDRTQHQLEAARVERESAIGELEAELLQAYARLRETEDRTQHQLEAARVERESAIGELEAELLQAYARLREAEDLGHRQLEAAKLEREAFGRALDAATMESQARLREADERARRQVESATLESEAVRVALDAELLQAHTRLRESEDARQLLEERVQGLERTCDQAFADRHDAENALTQLAARHDTLTEERTAERQRVLQMLDEMAVKHRQDLVAARNAPEWERLSARLEERDAAARALEAECARLQEAIDGAEERHRLERQEHDREAQKALAWMEQNERNATAQRDALQDRLDQALLNFRQCETALRHQDAAHRDLVAAHAETAGEYDRLLRAVRQQALRMRALADGVVPADDDQWAAGEAAALGARGGGRRA